MKFTIRQNNLSHMIASTLFLKTAGLFAAIIPSAGIRKSSRALLMLALLLSLVIAPLAQSPIPQPGSSLPPLKLGPVALNVVTKTKDLQLSLTPTSLSAAAGLVFVSGTGLLKLDGTLVNTSGCCARIKLEILRRTNSDVFNGNPGQVFKQQTFEFCGSQPVNISDNLSASQDDARFTVKITNLDAWNTVSVTGNLRLTYPTADRILAPQPNIPIDLTRGVDVTRTFELAPNTAGRLKIEIRWTGGASLQAKLFKPGQQPGPASSSALTQNSSSGAIDLNYNITPADIAAGNQWAINVLNNSASSVTATGITFRVIYTVEQ